MQISRWKKYLSYLWEVPLEQTSSPYNETLSVCLRRGRRQLCTANAIYSYDDLYDNFTKAFHRLRPERRSIENVLLLGLGLGSIPYTLERVFRQNYHYTAVEIDEAIVDLANRYTLQYLQSSIEIICADAQAYIAQSEATFDLICMDVFQDDQIPENFEHLNFLQALKERLRPKGWLLYNRLSLTQEDQEKTKTYFESTFRTVFPEGAYLDVDSNWILSNRALDGGYSSLNPS